MSGVTNQLPYTELKPLPVQQDRFPRLQKLVARVSLAVVLVGFSASIGVAAGLAEIGIEVISGILYGTIIGAIATVVAAIFIPFPSNLCQYRLDTLEQVRGVQAKKEALEALDTLKQFFTYPIEQFPYPFTHHHLHREMMRVTQKLDRERPDVIAVWKAFLQHLHKTKLKSVDKEPIELNFNRELEHLEGKETLMKKEKVYSGWVFGYDEQALDQIEEIQKASFGKSGTFSKEEIKEIVSHYPNANLDIIRCKKTGEVLGFCLCYRQGNVMQIGKIACKPEASNLRIGSELLFSFLQAQDKSMPVQVSVHKNNPATHFFKHWGFVPIKELPQDSILMQLNWEEYKKVLSQVNQP